MLRLIALAVTLKLSLCIIISDQSVVEKHSPDAPNAVIEKHPSKPAATLVSKKALLAEESQARDDDQKDNDTDDDDQEGNDQSGDEDEEEDSDADNKENTDDSEEEDSSSEASDDNEDAGKSDDNDEDEEDDENDEDEASVEGGGVGAKSSAFSSLSLMQADDDHEAVFAVARKLQKPVMVIISSAHCPYCVKLAKSMKKDAKMAQLMQKFASFHALDDDGDSWGGDDDDYVPKTYFYRPDGHRITIKNDEGEFLFTNSKELKHAMKRALHKR